MSVFWNLTDFIIPWLYSQDMKPTSPLLLQSAVIEKDLWKFVHNLLAMLLQAHHCCQLQCLQISRKGNSICLAGSMESDVDCRLLLCSCLLFCLSCTTVVLLPHQVSLFFVRCVWIKSYFVKEIFWTRLNLEDDF